MQRRLRQARSTGAVRWLKNSLANASISSQRGFRLSRLQNLCAEWQKKIVNLKKNCRLQDHEGHTSWCDAWICRNGSVGFRGTGHGEMVRPVILHPGQRLEHRGRHRSFRRNLSELPD